MSDIDIMVNAMQAAGELLQMREAPCPTLAIDLQKAYEPFSEGARIYAARTPDEAKSQHRIVLTHALDTIDFQAGWYVLKGFFDDQSITNMSKETMKNQFLGMLYTAPNEYIFFEAREKAVLDLSNAGIITKSDYCPLETLIS